MKKFKLSIIHDHSHCELCGMEYASGYDLYQGRHLLSSVIPYAHCYDGVCCEGGSLYQAVSDSLVNFLGDSFPKHLHYHDLFSEDYVLFLQQELPKIKMSLKVNNVDLAADCWWCENEWDSEEIEDD